MACLPLCVVTSEIEQLNVKGKPIVSVKRFWSDEEMGLGRTCKEVENLRLQQLQIEEEIEQLERASVSSEMQIGGGQDSGTCAHASATTAAYLYLREIPNKPPPPYTPPGRTYIPSKEQDVMQMVDAVLDFVTAAMPLTRVGVASDLVPPVSLVPTDSSPTSVYSRFIYDLVRQLMSEAIVSDDQDAFPWEKSEHSSKCWIPQTTDEIIKGIVKDKIKIVFGFEVRSIKENLIVRWSRKKKDKVDELLAREAQAEEHEWTDFMHDETLIKNKITLSILDCLVLETGKILQTAFTNKTERIKSIADC